MSNAVFMNKQGFTSIDNEIFYLQSTLSASAFSLLIRIYRATRGYGVAAKALSGSYLRKTTNLSKNTITNAIKELEGLGILLVKRRARLNSYYQLSVSGVSKVYAKIVSALSVDLEEPVEEVEVFETEEVTEESKEPKEVIDDAPFNIFWGVYDKKVAKNECRKVWNKLDTGVHLKVMEHLDKYIPSTPDKKYRKDPLNYLKEKYWENEVAIQPVQSKVVENKTQQPQKIMAPEPIKREDVIVAGSEADSRVNDFLNMYKRKGETYA